MTEFQKIIRNAASLLLSGTFSQIVLFIVNIYLARRLGPIYFGILVFAQTFASHFVNLSGLGYNYFGTREVALNRNNLPVTVGRLFGLKIIVALFLFCVLTLSLFILHLERQDTRLIFIFGLEVLLGIFFLDWVYQGLEEMHLIAAARIVNVSFYALSVWLLTRYSIRLDIIATCYLLGLAFGTLILGLNYLKRFGRPLLEFHSLRRDFRRTIPFALTNILNHVMFNANILIIGFLLDKSSVGIYSAYSKIAMLIIMIIGIYLNAIYPAAARLYPVDRSAFDSLNRISVKFCVLLAGFCILTSTTIGRDLIYLIYGPQYVRQVNVFTVLLIMVAQMLVSGTYGRALLAAGYEAQMLRIMIASSIISILLCLLLIPRFGIMGAAFAALVTEIVAFFLQIYCFCKISSIQLLHPLIKILFLVLAVNIGYRLITIFLGNSHFIASSLIISVMYFLGIYISSLFDKREFVTLLRQFRPL